MNIENGLRRARAGELRLPSRAFRVLLLEAAVLAAWDELGIPLNEAGEEAFQNRVSELYRGELEARRTVGRTWFDQQARLRVMARRSET